VAKRGHDTRATAIWDFATAVSEVK
jgi:hypothetical protein